MTTLGRAALLLVLTACGGHVGHAERQTDGGASGGARGEAAEVAGDGGDGTAGAVNDSAAGAVNDGAAGAAGERAIFSVPLISSGSRYCENELFCFGLSCYAPPALEQHVCVTSCESDDDCGAREVCLASANLDPGCYHVCQSPLDCEYGFDCFDFAGTSEMLVCFPTPWARVWPRRQP